MNIYQRINECRKAVDYIRKDKKVQGYMAVTHDAVTAATRKHMIEHGVLIVPSLISATTVNTGQETERGTPIIRYEATYSIKFVNIEDKDDLIEMIIPAHANDTGDKAPGKSISYATKFAVLKLLSLETGEDEEGRTEGRAGVRFENHQADVRKHFDSIYVIKQALHEGDLGVAAGAWYELDNETKANLWLAPTKGGIFTTEERHMLHSKEFREAHYGPEEDRNA